MMAIISRFSSNFRLKMESHIHTNYYNKYFFFRFILFDCSLSGKFMRVYGCMFVCFWFFQNKCHTFPIANLILIMAIFNYDFHWAPPFLCLPRNLSSQYLCEGDKRITVKSYTIFVKNGMGVCKRESEIKINGIQLRVI